MTAVLKAHAFQHLARKSSPQRHHLGAFLQHGRCIEQPVNKADLLRRPVTGGGVEVVNRPFRAMHIAGVPVQVF